MQDDAPAVKGFLAVLPAVSLTATLPRLAAWALVFFSTHHFLRPANGTEAAALVPADAAVCVQLHDLDGHLNSFTAGQLYARLMRYPPVREWAEANTAELDRISGDFERELGVPPETALRALLGDTAVMAVWPPSAPGLDDGPALVVFKAADTAVMDRVIDALCEAQRRGGKLRERETITADGRSFEVRVIEPDANQPPVWITVLGEFGVVTNRRPILRKVVDLYTGVQQRSLAESPDYQAAMARVDPRAAATLYVNPRPWDSLIEREHDRTDAPAGDAALLGAWSRVHYFVGALDFREHVSLEAYLEFHAHDAQQEFDDVVASFSGAARFAGRIPRGALVAFVGRIDVGRLTRSLLASGQPTDAHRRSADELSRTARGFLTGVDLFDDIMAGLGPDMGAYLAAAPHRDAESLPFDLVLGIDTQPRWSGDRVPAVTDVLDHALRTVLGVLVLVYNLDKGEIAARLETTLVDGLRMTSVTGVEELGADGGLAYAFLDGTLWAGSSRQAVRDVVTLKPEDSLARSPRQAALPPRRIDRPSHALWVDFAGLRDLLAEHPGVLRSIREDQKLDLQAAQQNLNELVSLLSLADALIVEVQVEATGIGTQIMLSADGDSTRR